MDAEEIRSRSVEDTLDVLVDFPEQFCEEKIFLIDLHLGTNLSDLMRTKLLSLKDRILNDSETYIAEQLILLISLMHFLDEEVLP